MGRYAYFNTGLEYKFSFAVQDSQDIWQFGGEKHLDAYMKGEDEHPTHSWEQEELPNILKILKELEEDFGLPEVNWSSFSGNLEGTHKLIEELYTYLDRGDADHCLYWLGCIIYHQLTYEPMLSVSYEL